MPLSSLEYQFLQLALSEKALSFGEFTLKSGRISPYFFNAAHFCQGQALLTLGQLYAQKLATLGLSFDTLFGPAYKGIPLATATAIGYAQLYQHDLPVAFNRKEAKQHGEGGKIIGASLSGKVVLIDDVITAGTAIRESIQLIHQQQGELVAVVVALDRQERGQQTLSAIAELKAEYGIEVFALATVESLLSFLQQEPKWTPYYSSVMDYRQRYGSES